MAAKPRSARWFRVILALLAVAAVGGGGWFVATHGNPLAGHAKAKAAEAPPAGIVADVVKPKPGGVQRVCVQPGTLEPFEAADLYAKVSGFLAEQTVDIGSRVKKGDVLARIAVPEHEKQLAKEAADIRRAEAKVQQMAAAVASSEADLRAATATVALTQAESRSKTSYRAYREKQRERIKDLAAQKAIDAKLADEQEDQYQAAVGAELAASESVNSAKQKEEASRAKVEQAKADRKYAEAEVAVARAQLEKTEVLTEYAVVKSPYDGIVTRRSFNRGDFVRSADAGGERIPILSVERTDVMRLVIQVPDRDVPYVSVGDPAAVEIDALPGLLLETHGTDVVAIARAADSEDPHTRTMRTEVDLQNPDGRLRRGMYGRVTLTLYSGAADACRVPSAVLTGKAEGGKGTVRVVRDGKVQTVPVKYGADNGLEVEILSGLTPNDQVVTRTSAAVDDKTPVTVSQKAAGH